MKNFLICLSFFAASLSCQSRPNQPNQNPSPQNAEAKITTGAERLSLYLPMIREENVGLVVNQTSLVGDAHLIDTLLSLNVPVRKIFALEHGFRGDKGAGETVANAVDQKTGLPVLSLYGKSKKPTPEQLTGIDVIVFDIQDVGARFYTYISAMHYIMEACAENGKKMIILDRPNPNGHYFDGPVLQQEYQSYVGMHPIPIVHGLTVGELARMINGEKWLKNGIQCNLEVIPVKNYDHQSGYSLPVKPSPNLPNDLAIALYPSLCLFEGTQISVARGTYFPFQAIGYPDPAFGDFIFTPQSIEGMAVNPPHVNKTCYGIDFRDMDIKPRFTLKYLIEFYNKFPEKDKFFNNFFDTLAGTSVLRERIIQGWEEQAIRKGWAGELDRYKVMRRKYLLYPE